MSQRVATSENSLQAHDRPAHEQSAYDQPIVLSEKRRLDNPHWFFSQLLQFDLETENQDEQTTMSWRSKLSWWCSPRQWVRTIIHLDDTPHSIALGTAIGVFIGLTPTFGIQMLLVFAVAFAAKPIFSFNKFAALVAVYISNPFTMVPIYWFNYQLGTVFIPSEITWDEFVRLFRYNSYSEWVFAISNVFYTLGAPLVIGSLLVATFFSLPTYPFVLRLVEGVQQRRLARKAKKSRKATDSSVLREMAHNDPL